MLASTLLLMCTYIMLYKKLNYKDQYYTCAACCIRFIWSGTYSHVFLYWTPEGMICTHQWFLLFGIKILSFYYDTSPKVTPRAKNRIRTRLSVQILTRVTSASSGRHHAKWRMAAVQQILHHCLLALHNMSLHWWYSTCAQFRNEGETVCWN